MFNNWTSGKKKPNVIYQKGNKKDYQLWMFKTPGAIELTENDTQYELADITGTMDRTNDTLITGRVRSYQSPSSTGRFDDYVREMYDEFVVQIRALAKLNTINVYAYLILRRFSIKRTRFYAEGKWTFLLTRKGVGH